MYESSRVEETAQKPKVIHPSLSKYSTWLLLQIKFELADEIFIVKSTIWIWVLFFIVIKKNLGLKNHQ